MRIPSLILCLALFFLVCGGAVAAAPGYGDLQPVIIIMKEQPPQGTDPVEMVIFSKHSQMDLASSLNSMGATKGVVLWSVNAIATALTDEQMQLIAARSDVAAVVPDLIVTLGTFKEPADTDDFRIRFFQQKTDGIQVINPADPSYEEIGWGVSWIEAPEVWKNGIDGTGVTVAIIDTGIFPDHPDIEGKVVGWLDLINDIDHPYDDHGHGTWCAGVVAGSGASGPVTGVAPGADLIGIKVFNEEGWGFVSTIIAGFEAAVERGADIISFSGGVSWYDGFSGGGIITSSDPFEIPFEVIDYEIEGYDPSFILLEVETPRFADPQFSLIRPDGSVCSGVDCTWYTIYLSPGYRVLKVIGDEPIMTGNWTFCVTIPSFVPDNMVWYSGRGDYLNNILNKTFDLTDHIENLDMLTFQMATWYDIEYGFDNGYLEVFDMEAQDWYRIHTFTGTGEEIFTTDNLIEYVWYEDGSAYLDIQLRYETDYSVVYDGWYIDWMEIPEIGFYDDASLDLGWIRDPIDGWSRISEQYRVDMFGISYYTDDGSSLLSRSANQVVEEGIVFVSSAGNNGGLGLRTIGGPAAAANVIAVGSINDQQDYLATWSSRGPSGWGDDLTVKPDVVAPGSSIPTIHLDGGYRSVTGTSVACTHVSGLAALMLQANYSLTPGDIREILANTAVDLGQEGPDYHYGYGRISAWAALEAITPLEPPVYDAPVLYAGFGYDTLKQGTNEITAISWNTAPVADEEIHFMVWKESHVVLDTVMMTDMNGMAVAPFTVFESGLYDYQVSDSNGNSVEGWIRLHIPEPIEPLLIDTPWKRYRAIPDSMIPVKYTIVNPLTMDPYAGDVQMIIFSTDEDLYYSELSNEIREEYYNEVLTPVNGVIEAEIDGSIIPAVHVFIELCPIADPSMSLEAGDLIFFDHDRTITQVRPFVIRAKHGENATLLVKKYTGIEARPVRDGMYEMSVLWLYEADVRSLSEQFPAESSRLLAGRIEQYAPEYRKLVAKIEDMDIERSTVSYQLKNGIGKLTVPVPDRAYLGMMLYGEGGAFILVDIWPFMYHPTAPDAEPDRHLTLSGEWSGEYLEDVDSIVPGDEIHVTCQLRDIHTGNPMEGTVYLYTSDHFVVVTTGSDGYGYATLPARLRFEDAWYYNDLHVIGLSGDASAYEYVLPPYERVVITGGYKGGDGSGILTAGARIIHPAGNPIPMPGIFEISRQDYMIGEFFRSTLSPAATVLSAHIRGVHASLNPVPEGSYTYTINVKDFFFRGDYSQGNWWLYEMYMGATPIDVLSPPPDFFESAGEVAVPVRMAGGQAGVPVYLVSSTIDPYNSMDVDLFSASGGVDIQYTGADGSATLRMNVPENSQLFWEIGGGTPEWVFKTLTGYTIQDADPGPVTPIAHFIGKPATGTAPLTVRFTDLSVYSPDSWHWDFGDGTSAHEQNPEKAYPYPGTYTVSLTATNAAGSSTETKADYITVTIPPPPSDGPGGRATSLPAAVDPGIGGTYTFRGLSITSLLIETQADLQKVLVTVERIHDLPEPMTEPHDDVYQYISVTAPNLADEDIESVTIRFQIPVGYLLGNGMKPVDAALLQHVHGEWRSLETTLLSYDERTMAHYEAETSGLSICAIVLRKDGAVVSPPVSNLKIEMKAPESTPDAEMPILNEEVVERDQVAASDLAAPGATPTPETAPLLYASFGAVIIAFICFASGKRS